MNLNENSESVKKLRDRISQLESELRRVSVEAQGLKTSEEHFRTLSHLAWDCCWIRRKYPNGQTDRIWVIDSFEELTGYTHEEFEEVGREGLVHPEDLLQAMHYVDGPLGTSQHEFRIITKAGEVKWLDERMRVTEEEDGSLCILGATRDISERIIAQEERLNIENRLQQTQKLESIGVMVGGIAHDFNNLLGGVVGNVDLAIHQLSHNSPSRPLLDGILKSGLKAASLVQKMIESSGMGTINPQPVNLSKSLAEVIEQLRKSIPTHTQLQVNLPPQVPKVLVDELSIHQLLRNLIVNAVESQEEAGGEVLITASAANCSEGFLRQTYLDDGLPSGSYLRLRVADTGSGIPKENLSKIFDPFFSTKFIGRGLGLATVLATVRHHRGALKIRSTLGQGTIFDVFLPTVENVESNSLSTQFE